MKSLGLLALLAITFGFGYGSGANHKFPDLDPLFGISRPMPAPRFGMASPAPVPGAWMNDPHRKTTLDAPAHDQTHSAVQNGWATYYNTPSNSPSNTLVPR
jgi:hypothetical protein